MSVGVLAIVPARGGSKGIPGKNLRLLGGKPLLEYAAQAAQASGVVDRIVLTTDSEEIAAAGRELGLEVPFLRPPELARDDTPMLPVIEHALSVVEGGGWTPQLVLILQPTAPLRTGSHVTRAVELLRASGATSVVSVVPIPEHYSPSYAMKIVDGKLRTFLPEGADVVRRQDAEPAYSRDGTVYAVLRDVIVEQHDIYGDNCVPLVLDPSESINLDTPEDWAEAERRLARA